MLHIDKKPNLTDHKTCENLGFIISKLVELLDPVSIIIKKSYLTFLPQLKFRQFRLRLCTNNNLRGFFGYFLGSNCHQQLWHFCHLDWDLYSHLDLASFANWKLKLIKKYSIKNMKQRQLFLWLEQISATISFCGKFWQEKLKNTKDKIVSVRLLSFYFGGSKLITFLAKLKYILPS